MALIRSLTTFGAFVWVSISAANSHADEYPVEISALIGPEWTHYTREVDNPVNTTERGTLSGFGIEAQLAPPSYLFARARFASTFGATEQRLVHEDLSEERNRFQYLSLSGEAAVGARIDLDQDIFAALYVGVGRRFWRRGLAASDFNVEYGWWFAPIGLLIEGRPTALLRLHVDIAAVPSFAAEARLHFPRELGYRDAWLEPGGKLGFRSRVGLGVAMSRKLTAAIIASYEYSALSESQPVLITTADGNAVTHPSGRGSVFTGEPGSRTHRVGAMLQVSYTF